MVISIGVVGASGQVGTEVCLFLRTYPSIRVIAIVRAAISGAILRRCGIEVRVGTFSSAQESIALIGDCDVVVDFSTVSGGNVGEALEHYRKYVISAIAHSKPHTKYIFISSVNAFGVGDHFNKTRNYILPHSVYGYTKR